jgi:hypothetical protein
LLLDSVSSKPAPKKRRHPPSPSWYWHPGASLPLGDLRGVFPVYPCPWAKKCNRGLRLIAPCSPVADRVTAPPKTCSAPICSSQ